jgi:branched-chain amino acid transport system substrate-binding protein
LATSRLLTDQSFDYVNRIVPREDVYGAYAAEYARESMDMTSAVVVEDDTPKAAVAVRSFLEELIAGGGQQLEGVRLSPSVDVTGVVELIGRVAPSVVFVSARVDTAGSLARSLGEHEIDVPVIVRGSACSRSYVDIAGDAAEGDVGVRNTDDVAGTARGRDFIAYFETTHGEPPRPCAAYAYDGVWVFVRTVLDVGADRTDVGQALREKEYSGVTGDLGFDENGDTTNQEVGVFEVVDGEWQAVSR